VELLWADRQSLPDEALLRGNLPDTAQVAEPAEPAPKHDLNSDKFFKTMLPNRDKRELGHGLTRMLGAAYISAISFPHFFFPCHPSARRASMKKPIAGPK